MSTAPVQKRYREPMSSVHSQGSDVAPTGASNKTGAPPGNGMGSATRTSSNNSNKSTITFEKQKVMPRTRTQSVPSVLSSISLRSMMGKHQDEPVETPAHGACVGIPASQQIQSPAIASSQKKTGSMHNNEVIGQRLPFTNDKRRQPEPAEHSKAGARTSRNGGGPTPGYLFKPGYRTTDPGSIGSHAISEQIQEDTSQESDDDAAQQKKLTTDALRRLSALKGPSSAAGDTPLPVASPRPEVREDYDNIGTPEVLTHIQFGGKNIILDSSIPNKRGSIAPVKPPLDMLPATLESSSKPKSKRPLRQINAPKKPLYTPAVLRDISETNITNAELNSPGPPILASQNQGTHTSRSSVRSIRSTSSSIISDYTKKLSSLWAKNPAYANAAEITPPTKTHWVSDSKRHACHYCHKIFTFWERKHHCRHCGDIFCSQHVRHWLYLDKDARFVIGGAGVGALSKICDGCLQEYDKLVREGPSSSAANAQTTNETPKSTTPVAGIDATLNQKDLVDQEGKRGRMDSIVGSVPADWNWSSF
ncbi:FYVE-type domain-containing protein [Lachancea thermotolerans]